MKSLKKLMAITGVIFMAGLCFSCKPIIDSNSFTNSEDLNPTKIEYVDIPEDPIDDPLPAVIFSANQGNVKLNTKVTLSVSDSETLIHYTTDGSMPTEESPVYSEPIMISADTVIKAVSVKEGRVSDCYKRTYHVYRQTGSKYSDEAKAVGDIVFQDGSAEPYSEDLVITENLRNQIVGVVFNTPGLNNGYEKTLIIGLNRGNKWQGAWLGTRELRTKKAVDLISDVQDTCPGNDDYIRIKNAGRDQYVTGKLSGSGSYSSISECVNLDIYYLEDSAFKAVLDNYEYGFYLPSLGEMELLSAQKSIVEKALQKAGDQTNLNGYFWTSSQVYFDNAPEDANYAWSVRLDNGSYIYKDKSSMAYVCGVKEL